VKSPKVCTSVINAHLHNGKGNIPPYLVCGGSSQWQYLPYITFKSVNFEGGEKTAAGIQQFQFRSEEVVSVVTECILVEYTFFSPVILIRTKSVTYIIVTKSA
jgi:hypothetical protein